MTIGYSQKTKKNKNKTKTKKNQNYKQILRICSESVKMSANKIIISTTSW